MKINVEGIEIDFSDKLIEVLKAEPDNAYEKFISNFKMYWHRELSYSKKYNPNFLTNDVTITLRNAFVWGDALEGFDYWCGIDDRIDDKIR